MHRASSVWGTRNTSKRIRAGWSYRVAAGFLAATTLTGCALFTDPDSNPKPQIDYYDHPAFAPLARALLPYRLHDSFVRVERPIWYINGVAQQKTSEPVLAIAALDSVIAVVFPDADAGGDLTLAFAGSGIPWSKEKLLPADAWVDVDAVGRGDTAHIVARTRLGDVHYLRWSNGSPLHHEILTKAPEDWRTEDCPDLAIGVAPNGTLDVLYLADPLWMHAHHDGNAWVEQPVRDGYGGDWGGLGCRSMIDYDENGFAYAMGLSRTYLDAEHKYAVHVDADDAHEVPSLKMGANGRFQPAGSLVAKSYAPLAPHVPDDRQFQGNFWLDAHPTTGGLFGAMTLDQVEGGLTPFSATSMWRTDDTGGTGTPAPFREACDGTGCSADYPLWGKLFEAVGTNWNACGQVELYSIYGYDDPIIHGWKLAKFKSAEIASCDDPARAPIVWRADDALDTLSMNRPAFTHGVRPYTAAVCSNTAGDMAICFGGWGQHLSNLGTAAPHEMLNPDDPPMMSAADVIEINYSSIAEGDEVDPGLQRIEIGMTKTNLQKLRPVLWDTTFGIVWPGVERTIDAETGHVIMTLTEPLQAGHHFRIELAGGIPDEGQYISLLALGKWRAVRFKAAGSLGTTLDERDVLARPLACSERSADGKRCILRPTINDIDLFFGEGTQRGFPEPDFLVPLQLVRADNSIVSTTTTWDWFTVGGRIDLNEPLEAGATYTFTLPTFYTHWGTELTDAVYEVQVAP